MLINDFPETSIILTLKLDEIGTHTKGNQRPPRF